VKTICCLVCVMISGLVSAQSPQQFADIGDFKLQSGAVIINARVGYRLAGTLNAEKSNVLIMPSWHMGSTGDLFGSDLIGPGLLGDTDRYLVIAIDAIGDGVSSSPSNSPDQPDKKFPQITITDMVNSQYELVSRHLGIKHVRAITGLSMGGMQALEWLGQYPQFMDKVVSVEGTPQLTSYDLIQWRLHMDTIGLMQNAGIEDQVILHHLLQLNLLTLWTPDYFVQNLLPENVDDYVTTYQTTSTQHNLHNYLLQTHAMTTHDVLGYDVFRDPDGRQEMREKLLMIGFENDHMVNPEPAKALAASLNSRYVNVSTNCGHMGTSCKQTEIAEIVHSFLK